MCLVDNDSLTCFVDRYLVDVNDFTGSGICHMRMSFILETNCVVPISFIGAFVIQACPNMRMVHATRECPAYWRQVA